jgi:hypothetical protein
MYSSAALQANAPRQSSPYPLESTMAGASPRGGSLSSGAGIYAEPTPPPSQQQRFLNRHYNNKPPKNGSNKQNMAASQGSLQGSRGRLSGNRSRTGGTSTSSSDNMSDATYPDDLVKDNRLHMESGEYSLFVLYYIALCW